MLRTLSVLLLPSLLVAANATAEAPRDQDKLVPVTTPQGSALRFDWPDLQIGVGTYEEGPTGITLFKFARKATAVVDVRGGAPGTVNTDALRLGINAATLSAIVFSGGSLYGEEAITAVPTALKDAGEMSGTRGTVGLVAGAIIYDFDNHRLNEVYPDKRLARATLRSLRPGVFPQGAEGAGRSAMQGSYLGCGAHSGQGGAFRQIGDVKIAAFTVVNAVGSVVDRAGRIVRCHRDPAWRETDGISELLARFGAPAGPVQAAQPVTSAAVRESEPDGPTANTTVSLIVTNRKMTAAELQRLAVHVHSTMSRAIQPYSTVGDGDTLYAVSTQEVDVPQSQLSSTDLGVAGGELMWDAVLASVPPDDATAPSEAPVTVPPARLAALAGRYDFGGKASMRVTLVDGSLRIATDGPAFFNIPNGPPATLMPVSDREFRIAGRYATRIAFTTGRGGKVTGAIVDPGRWAQRGERVD